MPTLNWIGKDAVVKHHKDVPSRLLEPVPELSCPPLPSGEGSGVRESGNLIVQGDNLHALKALLPRYARQVEVHLHRSALQHRQRGLGLQRQRQQPGNPPLAGRSGRQGRRDSGPT